MPRMTVGIEFNVNSVVDIESILSHSRSTGNRTIKVRGPICGSQSKFQYFNIKSLLAGRNDKEIPVEPRKLQSKTISTLSVSDIKWVGFIN